MRHRLAGRVEWRGGPVGEAVAASLDARLRRFVRDEESEPVVLFGETAKAVSDAGDWYGEHLGKWLAAASHAARRTGDPALVESLRRVVEFVAAQQEPDGYLGTYAAGAACRMDSSEAEGVRTWDVWVHSWTMLGLLAADGVEGLETLATAGRIGDLLLATFADRSPLGQGNHAGLSAGVVVHSLAELTLATGDPRYAALARRIVGELDQSLGFLSKGDVAEIGTGKAYQILWILVGLVALHQATDEPLLLEAAERLWTNVHDLHLTPLGGPWGGLQGHKETFAPAGAFSPHGMVETCGAATWMALSRSLFAATGSPRYVEAYERTLMNALLGALDENGADWIYFTLPNGHRRNTYHWACCRSSGAMALEEAADLVASATDDAVWLHLLLPCRVEIEGATIEIDEELRIMYEGEKPLRIRIPGWAESDVAQASVPAGSNSHASGRGGLRHVEMLPHSTIRLPLSTPIRVVPFTHSVDHHGQEIVRTDYATLQRGPYVYATGLIDGYKKEETLRLPRLTPEAPFRLAQDETEGGRIELHAPGRDPIPFLPYYRAGGRHDGAWRATWMQIAWQ